LFENVLSKSLIKSKMPVANTWFKALGQMRLWNYFVYLELL